MYDKKGNTLKKNKIINIIIQILLYHGIMISNSEELNKHHHDIKKAFDKLHSKKSRLNPDGEKLRSNLEQLLGMSKKIKFWEKYGTNKTEHHLLDYCPKEHEKGIDRLRTIVKVLWPIYQEDLAKLK